MSFANLNMYAAVIPSYNPKGEEKKTSEQDVIDAEDPANREAVRKFFELSD